MNNTSLSDNKLNRHCKFWKVWWRRALGHWAEKIIIGKSRFGCSIIWGGIIYIQKKDYEEEINNLIVK